MKAYWPLDATIFLVVLAILAASLGLGFAVTHVRPPRVARACAWLLVVSSTFGLERLTIAEGAGFRMLTISGALLFSMKAVVSVEHQAGGQRRLRAVAWFGFASLWPGMRPSVFDGVPGPSREGASALIKKGAGRLIVGVLLVGCAVALARLPDRVCGEEGRRILATVFLLPGLSLTFHFGVFNLLAGLWRFAGAGTNSLFRAPLAAKTLGEFWGRRWNLAFSEMTAIGVFRPLSRCVPTGLARALAFAFSGVLHELAISVPVQAGYGLPMAYFALHGLAVTIEPRFTKSLSGTRWGARAWTLTWLVIPLPLLFHDAFLSGCAWPLVGLVQ